MFLAEHSLSNGLSLFSSFLLLFLSMVTRRLRMQLMGNEQSRPQTFTPPPRKVNDRPWRPTKGWDLSVRNELKNITADLAPETRGQLNVPFFNIVLTGQIGAGKSSFFNSLNSIFTGKVVSGKAEVGKVATSLTKEFRIYEIRPKPSSDPYSWKICDTAGMKADSEVFDLKNILSAIDGHVPDGFEFLDKEIYIDTSGYIATPELKDKAHCVAVVIDGSKVATMKEDMKRKLRNLRTGLITRNIPTYILLTHIDEVCEEVAEDLRTVYKSIPVRDLVSKVSKMLHGLPENQIFPVMNYQKQVDLDNNMDILLLYAFRQMLYSAQGHLENKI